jgi:hypothetical protein
MSGSEAVRSGLAAHAAAGADHLIVALEPATVEAVERLARDVDAWRAVDAAAGSSVDAA